MSAVILIHIGDSTPDHLWDCAEQVRRFYPGNIHVVIPERDTTHPEIERIGLYPTAYESLVGDPAYREFERACFLDGFWNVTAGRLFLLEILARQKKLSNIIHIENDVLIYRNPEELMQTFCNYSLGRVLLTPVGEYFTTAAYLYSRSSTALSLLTRSMLAYLKKGKRSLEKLVGGNGVNEMTILSLIAKKRGIIRHLPIQPSGGGSKGTCEFDSVFDPASHGQFLGGTMTSPPGWAERRHYIGNSILDNNISYEWGEENGIKIPFLICKSQKNRKYRINNLHIHSKNLKEFM